MQTIKIEVDDQAYRDLAEYAMAQGKTITEHACDIVLSSIRNEHRAQIEAEKA